MAWNDPAFGKYCPLARKNGKGRRTKDCRVCGGLSGLYNANARNKSKRNDQRQIEHGAFLRGAFVAGLPDVPDYSAVFCAASVVRGSGDIFLSGLRAAAHTRSPLVRAA